MVANTNPIFGLTVKTPFVTVAAADTSYTAPSTAGVLLMTAGADGDFIKRLLIKALGTNSNASVLRVFVNNGGAIGTAGNNALIKEFSLPQTTATQTAALTDFELPMNFALQGGYKIYVAVGTAGAAGWAVCAEMADY